MLGIAPPGMFGIMPLGIAPPGMFGIPPGMFGIFPPAKFAIVSGQ